MGRGAVGVAVTMEPGVTSGAGRAVSVGMERSRNLIVTVLAFCLVAVLLGFLASPAYALVALLVGAIVVAAIAIAAKVVAVGDAPFAQDDETAVGDTTQHSDESSAVSHAPR